MDEVGGTVRQTATAGRPPLRTRAELVPAAADDTTGWRQGERPCRAGRGLLVVEGLAIGVLGGVALAWSMGHTRFGADGMPLLGLRVTPQHAGLLLVAGTLTLLACLGRRTALIFSTLTAIGWAGLTIVCALKVANHAPGVLGFDPRDSLLYGTLCAYNVVTSVLLALAMFKWHRGLN